MIQRFLLIALVSQIKPLLSLDMLYICIFPDPDLFSQSNLNLYFYYFIELLIIFKIIIRVGTEIELWRMISYVRGWSIWMERNRLVFKGVEASIKTVWDIHLSRIYW